MMVLFSDVTQLMGKWAYTARILYSNPYEQQPELHDLSLYIKFSNYTLVTPLIMLDT